MTDNEKFMQNVSPEPNSGCWLWTGHCNAQGYGRIRIAGLSTYAHRASWELHKGEVGGKIVCHSCDVPACVNPDHLWVGTQKDNVADCKRKGRRGIGGRRGEEHPASKLSADDVRRIRNDPRSGRFFANTYGVSEATISQIRSGKSWRSV